MDTSGYMTNKRVMSLYPWDLWSPNLAEWWLMIKSQNYKIKCSFDHVVMWGHVKNKSVMLSLPQGLVSLNFIGKCSPSNDKGWPPNGHKKREWLDEWKS